MSTRYDGGSHYENHPAAAELHDHPEHVHRVAEHEHGKPEHLSAHEQTRQSLEHLHGAHQTTPEQGAYTFGHAEIAALAYELWQARGCPEGSPEQDWHEAAKELRARMPVHGSLSKAAK